jgi:hypothetical protein
MIELITQLTHVTGYGIILKSGLGRECEPLCGEQIVLGDTIHTHVDSNLYVLKKRLDPGSSIYQQEFLSKTGYKRKEMNDSFISLTNYLITFEGDNLLIKGDYYA